jgi:hypothetical protein
MTQESLEHNVTSADIDPLNPEGVADGGDDPNADGDFRILSLLADILDAVQRRENPAPSSFIATQFPTTVSVRLTTFVFSVTAAAAVTIKIGSATEYTFNLPGADTRVVPLSIVIKEGTDVVVATSAGVVTWFFLGYPE